MDRQTAKQLTDIKDQLLHLGLRLDQQRDRQSGLVMVVSWLLAQHSSQHAQTCLMTLSHALEHDSAYAEQLALFVDLSEEVQRIHASASPQG
ncbi:MAG: hypothetical protein K9L79_01515 [Methylobacter tundripaludum]|nr:hypothetical protein [Methylobacter tundripaludum]